MPRLRRYIIENAFDPQGSPLMHLSCLRAVTQMGERFITSCHREAVALCKAPTRQITKKQFVLEKLTEEDLIRPADDAQGAGSVLPHKEYLKSLGEQDKVCVKVRPGMHGLTGKASNNARTEERALFQQWVQLHRSPTGRTKDSNGRFHGAEYYMVSKIKTVKTQSGRAVSKPEEVLECVFKAALASQSPKLRAPGGTAIAKWLAEDFGIGSELGHTTVFPHQTDACATCSSIKIDVQGLEMSLKRHLQQGGDMTIERQTTIKELKQELSELQTMLTDHRGDAHRAQVHARIQHGSHRFQRDSHYCNLTLASICTLLHPFPRLHCLTAQEQYKERVEGARNEYMTLMHLLAEYLNPESAEACVSRGDLIKASAERTFHVDSDYQQDKLTPFWGSSPQPGPTYFYSKETQYIHIINSHSLGDASGASRLRRNHYYLRSQECAGSKYMRIAPVSHVEICESRC